MLAVPLFVSWWDPATDTRAEPVPAATRPLPGISRVLETIETIASQSCTAKHGMFYKRTTLISIC